MAVAIVALAGGCGGDSRRDAVVAYIDDANEIQRDMAVPLVAARHAYTELSRGDADLTKLRPQLTKAAETMDTLEHRLTALKPPPEAKRLHTLLLRLVETQAGLAHELELLADFVPQFEQRLEPLRAAERRLRTALAAARTAGLQAAAIDRYGRDVGAVLRTLDSVRPPAPMAAQYETQVDTLTNVQHSAEALARALRSDAKVVPARIQQLAEAARAGTGPVAQRANIAAVKLYNRRISRLDTLAQQITVERGRLERTLR
jgi:hypothetical protein